jgi:uncharacterized delta-60 repeat protein
MALGEPTILSPRLTAVALACVVIVALALAPGARADAGGPVRSFGDDGSLVVRIPHRQNEGLPLSARRAPGHRLQVVIDRQVRQFDADGRPDPGFGTGGRLDLTAGVPGFEPTQLVPGSSGSFVVGGTTTRMNGKTDSQSSVTVRRYLPSGRPDPSFAAAGTFTSQLGFPTTTPAPEETAVTPFDPAYYGGPHVSLSRLSGDSRGRLLIEGEAVLDTSYCPSGLFYGSRERFAARLTAAGVLDDSFAPGGIAYPYGVTVQPCEGLKQGDEVRSPSYAFIGRPHHARVIASAEGTDARGRRVLLIRTVKGEKVEWHLARLTRGGRFDRGFGDDGKMTFHVPAGKREAFISAIRVAPDGSILLVGTIGPAYVPGHGFPDTRFYVGKVTKDGRVARSFGRDGFLTTGPPKVRIAEPITAVDIGAGQVALVGALGEFARQGYVLASVHPGA